MTKPEALEIFVIVSCDHHAGEQVRGDFYLALEAAKSEIDRLFEKAEREEPRFVEKLSESLNYGGFQVITKWGEWRHYSIRRIDRSGRSSADLDAEVSEGRKAKLGI